MSTLDDLSRRVTLLEERMAQLDRRPALFRHPAPPETSKTPVVCPVCAVTVHPDYICPLAECPAGFDLTTR